jgi:hypothetical protein
LRDGNTKSVDTAQILESGALRTAALIRWRDQLGGECEGERDIMYYPAGAWTSIITDSTGTLFVEDTQDIPDFHRMPDQRQRDTRPLASRVTHAEAIAYAVRYLVDTHRLPEAVAEAQARANLVDSDAKPIIVPAPDDQSFLTHRDARRIEFRYLTPPNVAPEPDTEA